MPWSGDISRMGQLAQRIADLAKVPSRAAKNVSRRLEELVEQEFDAGADPYGNAWAPLAEATLAKGRTPPPLTDTGAMRSSFHVTPLPGAGAAMTIEHPAAPHQTGWSGKQGTGPARPILPGREMPPLWKEAIQAAVEEEIRGAA